MSIGMVLGATFSVFTAAPVEARRTVWCDQRVEQMEAAMARKESNGAPRSEVARDASTIATHKREHGC